MTTDEKQQRESRPYIIANPIYDTVFKRLMENMKIVKFFLSTILGQQVTAVDVRPQEFTHRNLKEAETDGKDEIAIPYSVYRVDFMATVLTKEGEYRKILIEVQKSLGTVDVHRFHQYLGAQYSTRDTVIINKVNRKMTLPIITIYILGSKLAEIKCSCLKVGRTYTDMLTNEPVAGRDDFVEQLTHDSYIIQVGRIADNRYSTALEKLISVFEQTCFVDNDSEVVKEYRYHPSPEDEEMLLITQTLHEMGVDPEERREIENEAEFVRTIDDTYGFKIRELTEVLEERDKALGEKDKVLEEKDKVLEEKDKALGEKDKALEEQAKRIEEQAKALEEQAKKYAEMERMFRNKPIE
ncbi:MAG: hypothetical protein LBB84_10000 [Tannerellaceae bacterium]|nr:hypothetical protein [Tannerellaceae bacterium]